MYPARLKVCQEPPNRALEGLVSAHSLTGWAGSSDPSHDDRADVHRATRGPQAPSSAGSAVLASNRSVAARARRSALRSDRGHPAEIEPDLASRWDCADAIRCDGDGSLHGPGPTGDVRHADDRRSGAPPGSG